MKRLFLPIALLSFSVICLSIVHIDNVNKLDKEYNQLREKQLTVNNADRETSAIETFKAK